MYNINDNFMSKTGGTLAQYGFEFQKEVFVFVLINKLKVGDKASYEMIDDIDFNVSDLGNTKLNSLHVQCKTGSFNYSLFRHVICNWLLYDYTDEYILFIDNDLNFHFDSENLSEDIISDVKKYFDKKKQRIDCYLYKIFKKYNEFNSDIEINKLKSDLLEILNKLKIYSKTISTIKEESMNSFIEEYCTDINIEFAKKSRFEMFCDEIHKGLKKSIEEKKPYTIDFIGFKNLINRTIKSIDNHKYFIDYVEFKNSNKNIYKNLLSSREALFLKKMNMVEGSIVRYLTYELYYKDLRDYYVGIQKSNLINEIEEHAHFNYTETARKNNNIWVETFNNTINTPIDNDVLQNIQYTSGCYMFLSSDEAVNYFIDWCGENVKS